MTLSGRLRQHGGSSFVHLPKNAEVLAIDERDRFYNSII